MTRDPKKSAREELELAEYMEMWCRHRKHTNGVEIWAKFASDLRAEIAMQEW